MDQLANNPMVDIARKALTPEQEVHYKQVGQYMFSDEKMKLVQETSKPVETKDIIMYAIQSLKSGLNPMDLSKEEVDALNEIYGEKWYIRFDLKKEEVPQRAISIGLG